MRCVVGEGVALDHLVADGAGGMMVAGAALPERATGCCQDADVGAEVVDVPAGHGGAELNDVFFPGSA